MFKGVLPIIFVIAAVGLFYTYIDPTYQEIKLLQEEEQKFEEALTRSRELQSIRDQLLSRYNTFSATDILRLNKLLPDHIDNVRLALDIDGIASAYNMRIKNIAVTGTANNQQSAGAVGPSQQPYESVILSFSVASTYENLLLFLKDLEKSLRIVDITQLNFNVPDGDLYEYKISLQTYWLK